MRFGIPGAILETVRVVVEKPLVGFVLSLTTDPVLRFLNFITACFASVMLIGDCCAQFEVRQEAEPLVSPEIAQLELIEVEPVSSYEANPTPHHIYAHQPEAPNLEAPNLDEIDMSWLTSIKAGYDNGFVIASKRNQDLGTSNYPFWLRFNGWGQLRHTYLDSQGPNRNVNQFQLKRGRLSFTSSAFNSDFRTFVQLDGRSSSGDDIRMLDYYLSWDIGHARFGLERGTVGLVTGKYKMPFTMARWLSGRDFEFSDRSVASTFFDVNRSFGFGMVGQFFRTRIPVYWEAALFNGLVTGGAETGSSGTLDDNFAASARAHCYPIGDWGDGPLADFEYHECLAMRAGCGFAWTDIDRAGTTEFSRVRVVDSGKRLSEILDILLPDEVNSYTVGLFAVDASFKYRGWSSSLEYYFRSVGNFQGAEVSGLFDQGFWFQLGKFVIPEKLQLLARWSRVQGDSGTLGGRDQSSEEIAGGFAWYFRGNHAKVVGDLTYLNGAPIDSSSLDITPGEEGWLWRTQLQFSF